MEEDIKKKKLLSLEDQKTKDAQKNTDLKQSTLTQSKGKIRGEMHATGERTLTNF